MRRPAHYASVLLASAAATFGALHPGVALAAASARAEANDLSTVPVCSPNGTGLPLGAGERSVNAGFVRTYGGHPAAATTSETAHGEVYLSQSAYTADEDEGTAWITIERTDVIGTEQIRYGVKQATAQSPSDFHSVPNTLATLLPGQAACRFGVPITNEGMNGPSVTAQAYLFGSSGATLSQPKYAPVTILRNDPLQARSASNPLALSPAPTDGDPLTGARFYVPSTSSATEAIRRLPAKGRATGSKALRFIADQPQGYRFWYWNMPHPAGRVARYLEDAEIADPGTVIQLSTYSVVHGHCGLTANAAFTRSYLKWIHGLAEGIGNFRVVLFFEIDSIITSPCLTHRQLHIRLVEQLKPAIEILEHDPHVVLYLDAGASDALSAKKAAARLREAGVENGQGFFLNATHFQWDTKEIAYGQEISRLLGGGVHFLVDSDVNGRGPLLNPHPTTQGVEQLCNPPGRGLGPISTETGYTNLDGLLWFAPVGNSGGACRPGAPPTAVFWPAYAISLYKHRDFAVTGPKLPLSRDGAYEPYSRAFDR